MTFEAFGFGWLDGAIAGVLIVSLLAGLLRGLVYELLALCGWVVAFFVAQAFAGTVSAHLPTGAFGPAGSVANAAAGFALAFFGVLILWGLMARAVRRVVRATPISGIDRLLGAVFGTLRALVLLLIATTIVLLTPAHGSRAWQESVGARWLEALLDDALPLLPDALPWRRSSPAPMSASLTVLAPRSLATSARPV